MPDTENPIVVRMRAAGLIPDTAPHDATHAAPAAAGPVVTVGEPGLAAYVTSALDRECQAVTDAPEGARNDTLNTAAFNLGGLVGAGHLTDDVVTARLTAAAHTAGLNPAETRGTIRSGLTAGRKEPREVRLALVRDTPDTTTLDPAAVVAAGEQGHQRDTATKLPHLPEEFWEARSTLARIRAAAHSRCRSADVVLHAVLARVASLVHHTTTLDTGLGRASLNIITVPVGASGVGKSTAIDVARQLVEAPWSISAGDGYRDAPVGTGEGLAEMFMGTRVVETGEFDRRGAPKTEKRRAQVRHNAHVYVDEGEQLLRIGERSGSTIMTTLRSAWVGQVLGQANASEDRTRIIPAGTYALGVVIGLQPSKAGPLFTDAAGGTPQRCLFAAVADPSIPDDPVDWPGGLHIPDLGRPVNLELVDDDIRRQLRADQLAANRGELERPEMNSHEPLHLAKLAGLLAVLDGRTEVTASDWALGEVLWETSCAVRDQVAAGLVAQEEAEAAERGRRDASRQVMVSVAKADALEDRAAARADKVLESAAGSIARKVWRDGSCSRREAMAAVAGKHKKSWGPGLVTAAVDHAARQEWITVVDGVYRPGLTEPTS